MKWRDKNKCAKNESITNMREVIEQLAKGDLVIGDQKVILPDDMELDFKAKYSEEPGKTKFVIKVEWPNDIPVTEEERSEKKKKKKRK